ncbi:cysteine desulfurase [uncultured Psychrosphaera sp.]|uniref:aminotransferase class V-fold PLP-dependent enzyme n=1 Tax=uncultured Psychrosphaera sp. TaxID=1403522 RepID=UPI0030F924D1
MSIRSQFTLFSNQELNTPTPFIYLDNAATTQKPQSVIDVITHFYQHQNANVHRGSYNTANQVTARYEQARVNLANFIGAKSDTNIVWTKGTTESINLVAYAWGETHVSDGDTIVVLGSEHHANFVPWQQLALRKGANFEVVNVLENGDLDLAHYQNLMDKKPKLVAVQHCSNALGNIHPIKQLTELAKQVGATVLVDGAQAVAHIKVDVQDIGCDFYTFSGHKMYGPTGIGVLYIAEDIKHEVNPFHFGGEMIQSVTIEKTSFRPIPALLETGTPNISGVLGFDAAVKFMQNEQTQHELASTSDLYNYLISQLSQIDKVRLLGSTENNIGVISFVVDGESVADIGALLNEQNIAVRCGHHCAMPLMQALKVNGTVRVSLAIYNDKSDVDGFINALKKSLDILCC